MSDERQFTEAKVKIVELVQSLRKTDTSCFTKLQGYPKGHRDSAIESKIERASDIFYKLWDLSQQIGVRIFIVNTSAGTEVKLTKWGTLKEWDLYCIGLAMTVIGVMDSSKASLVCFQCNSFMPSVPYPLMHTL